MKIAYIEMGKMGHSLIYLKNLIIGHEDEAILLLSERIEGIPCQQIIIKNQEGKKRTLINYFKWLFELYRIVTKISPDIVHFLDGDLFYRFFGIGLMWFKRYNTIITLHWVRNGLLNKISIWNISRKVDRIVVHSDYLKTELESFHIKNSVCIDYPYFNRIVASKEEACKYWGLDESIKTLACIGSTRFDKGIDILIKALDKVTTPFQLLVAGQVNTFTEDDLIELSKGIREKVFLNIHYLNDEELDLAFAASDYIVLPYRKSFNGASGPLTEGVAYGKCIIGADYKNLGYTIKSNHLGYTFQCENIEDLTRVVENALINDFVKDKYYNSYLERINPELFRKGYRNLYQNMIMGRLKPD